MAPSSLRSFIPVAADSPFPIQNLPYGIFSPPGSGRSRAGVAIGDHVLDLTALQEAGYLPSDLPRGLFNQPSVNAFMALGRPAWRRVRAALTRLLREDVADLRDHEGLRREAFFARGKVAMQLPAEIGDYTDFYSSREHATNVGTMFRGRENALNPNWLHLPVGYHGRAGSVVASGTDIVRPSGQLKPDNGPPVFGPSARLDFELEVGCFVGPGTPLGTSIPIGEAEDHLFGLVLVNDWSARDIQRWEYVPLGPFLGKSFATTVSPWIVTLDALEPFRCPAPAQDPQPLPYLHEGARSTYDLHLEVGLRAAGSQSTVRITRSNFRYLYWTLAQQLAHQTVNGCNVRPGDLLASGTISGADEDSLGSLLELTWNGSKPLVLPGGEERTFLEDGDAIIMTAYAERVGFRIGFGEAAGLIVPARTGRAPA